MVPPFSLPSHPLAPAKYVSSLFADLHIPIPFLLEYICTATITTIITIKGISIITIKKSTGSLHANEDTISIAATNITANPAVVAIAADKLRLRRANTDDIENRLIIMPPTMTTPICACDANMLKPNDHFLVSRAKIVEAGTCAAMAKKINTAPMIPTFTASIE